MIETIWFQTLISKNVLSGNPTSLNPIDNFIIIAKWKSMRWCESEFFENNFLKYRAVVLDFNSCFCGHRKTSLSRTQVAILCGNLRIIWKAATTTAITSISPTTIIWLRLELKGVYSKNGVSNTNQKIYTGSTYSSRFSDSFPIIYFSHRMVLFLI